MYLAVDIGGTKTLLAAFDDKGAIKKSVKFPTPQDYEAFLTELEKTLPELGDIDFRAAGVAVPGKLDRNRGVAVAFGNLPWRNVSIEADIEKLVNGPIMIENDANLAGLSEAINIIKDYKKVLYVTISTGIGGVYVINGKIDVDTQDAEIGHMLLDHNGQLERWEDFASGKAIVAKYGKRASDIEDPKAWDEIARNIAIGLIDVTAALTPDAIVLGGGVGTHLSKFKSKLDADIKQYETPMITMPPVFQAKRPEEAVIYGCYELVKERYGNPVKTA